MPKKTDPDINGVLRMLAAANRRVANLADCLSQIQHGEECACTRCQMIRKALEDKA